MCICATSRRYAYYVYMDSPFIWCLFKRGWESSCETGADKCDAVGNMRNLLTEGGNSALLAGRNLTYIWISLLASAFSEEVMPPISKTHQVNSATLSNIRILLSASVYLALPGDWHIKFIWIPNSAYVVPKDGRRPLLKPRPTNAAP